MNEQQPYEKHLGDKLRDLPPPGNASRSWPQMKALLDKDMPSGPGGGNRRRWWIFGTIAAVLIGGLWIGSSMTSNKSDIALDKPAIANEHTASSNTTKTEEAGSVQNAPSPSDLQPSSHTAPDLSDKLSGQLSDNSTTNSPNNSTAIEEKSTLPHSNTSKSTSSSSATSTVDENLSAANKNNTTNADNSAALNSGTEKKIKFPEGYEKNNSSRKANISSIKTYPSSSAGHGNLTSGKKPSQKNSKNSSLQSGDVNGNIYASDAEESNAKASMVLANRTPVQLGDIEFPDSISAAYALHIPVPQRSRFKVSSPKTRALKNRVVGTGDNKNFAIGLSLPLAFPLSDQKAYAYNINAGANTALDYIPVPHFQYHISQKSYVQAEMQIASPQFIHPALLYETRHERPGQTNYKYVTNSVFAKKLYYFNLPLGIHYSPFRNFYVGSGIQFSSLMSGVALHEQRGYSSLSPSATDSLFSQSIQKFRNDTISNRLNSNEFRVMLDANYYWQRFTVGLRYNQALSNYVSLRVNSFAPLITDKNKSMQFYLRYNLWEDKKRKKAIGLASR